MPELDEYHAVAPVHGLGHATPPVNLPGGPDAGCVAIPLGIGTDHGRLGDQKPGRRPLCVIRGGPYGRHRARFGAIARAGREENAIAQGERIAKAVRLEQVGDARRIGALGRQRYCAGDLRRCARAGGRGLAHPSDGI
jgi:hypothetical protein